MDDMPKKLEALRTPEWWTRKKTVEEIIAIPKERFWGALAAWLSVQTRAAEDALMRLTADCSEEVQAAARLSLGAVRRGDILL